MQVLFCKRRFVILRNVPQADELGRQGVSGQGRSAVCCWRRPTLFVQSDNRELADNGYAISTQETHNVLSRVVCKRTPCNISQPLQSGAHLFMVGEGIHPSLSTEMFKVFFSYFSRRGRDRPPEVQVQSSGGGWKDRTESGGGRRIEAAGAGRRGREVGIGKPHGRCGRGGLTICAAQQR